VYVEAVEIDEGGARRGRLLDLTGENATIVDPRGSSGISAEVLIQPTRGDRAAQARPADQGRGALGGRGHLRPAQAQPGPGYR